MPDEGAVKKDKHDKLAEAFEGQLESGETLKHWAFGVKPPNILVIIGLIALLILPGIIAIFFMTKNYIVGLTDRRLLVVRVKGFARLQVQETISYGFDELKHMTVETGSGGVFTHIRIADEEKPFRAKFHRAFSKRNRPEAEAIAKAIGGG